MKLAVALMLALAFVPDATAADARPPSQTVRGFFSALEQHDFRGALALTEGKAAEVIHDLIQGIERQAARQHAAVELRVRELRLSEPASDVAGQNPVDVRFQIDVVGKKWMFSRVARTLSGSARFYVDDKAPRIVAIVGQLER